MLKKTALSLFGLVVMLICFNPPQAHAGVVVSSEQYIRARFTFARTGMLRLFLLWLTGRLLTFMPRLMFVRAGAIVQGFTGAHMLLRGTSIASS